ncbi:MAG TPA: hypothetical protein VHE53_01115 [Patescibacteria group bacterium]|nr:hypothetical protein [Patescibacteria group bacterium]
MIKKITNSVYAPFILAALIFVFFQSRIFNLGINFRDEGFLFLNAVRILSGDIPYKDFFMTTTPGSFYLIAGLVKLFGLQLIIARILYIIFVIILLFFVNLIYKFKNIYKYVLLVSVGLIFLGPSAIASYNIGALVFAIISFYFLCKGLEQKILINMFISGLFMALVFLFKQSYGIWVGLGFLLTIYYERYKEFGYRDSFPILYIFGGLISILPFVVYLYIHEALAQFIYYSGTFSRMVKSHRNPFIIKSLISVPLLFIGFKYILPKISIRLIGYLGLISLLVILTVNFIFKIHYFELSRIYYGIFIIFPIFCIALVRVNNRTNQIIRDSIFLLTLFLANASSGRELGTVMWVSPVFFPLIIEIGAYTASKYKKIGIGVLIISTFLVLIQGVYFSLNSINPNGRVYVAYKKDELNANLGSYGSYIMVSYEDRNELNYLVEKINVYPSERKLLCFPYCPLMNVITQRESPSYFNFFYPEAFLKSDQEGVISDIKKSNPIIVVQKVGKLELEANFEDKRFGILKNYIIQNYKKTFETKDFAVYE